MNNKNLTNKRLCIIDTPYSLFLYFLICGVNKDDIFVMSNHISKDIRKNINPIYFPYNNFYSNNSVKNIFILIRLIFEVLRLRIILHFKTKNCNVEVYGHAHLLFSFPLYEYENSNIIEDGIGNYADLPVYKEFPPLKKLFICAKSFRVVEIRSTSSGSLISRSSERERPEPSNHAEPENRERDAPVSSVAS